MSESSSVKRLVAFDLDGTLVDSREAVELAYRIAGVTMPDGAWGKPWQEWLDDPDVHCRKTIIYINLIQLGKVNVNAEVKKWITRSNIHPVVLTGASETAAVMLLNQMFQPSEFTVAGTSMSTAAKIAYLQSHTEISTYVDDDDKAVGLIRAACPNTRVIHYVGQTAEELQSEVQR